MFPALGVLYATDGRAAALCTSAQRLPREARDYRLLRPSSAAQRSLAFPGRRDEPSVFSARADRARAGAATYRSALARARMSSRLSPACENAPLRGARGCSAVPQPFGAAVRDEASSGGARRMPFRWGRGGGGGGDGGGATMGPLIHALSTFALRRRKCVCPLPAHMMRATSAASAPKYWGPMAAAPPYDLNRTWPATPQQLQQRWLILKSNQAGRGQSCTMRPDKLNHPELVLNYS